MSGKWIEEGELELLSVSVELKANSPQRGLLYITTRKIIFFKNGKEFTFSLPITDIKSAFHSF
jgi:hypothetical protein